MLQLGPLPALGHPRSIWFQRRPPETGVCVVITVLSTVTQCQTGTTHSQFFLLTTGCHNLLQTGSRACVPPHPSEPCRHTQDRRHNSIRTVRVREDALQSLERRSNVPALHGPGPPWSSCSIHIH